MQLNISTDYAIRLLLYLAKSSKIISSTKLAEAHWRFSKIFTSDWSKIARF